VTLRLGITSEFSELPPLVFRPICWLLVPLHHREDDARCFESALKHRVSRDRMVDHPLEEVQCELVLRSGIGSRRKRAVPRELVSAAKWPHPNEWEPLGMNAHRQERE